MARAAPPAGALAAGLPELAAVRWRPRASDESLARIGRQWTVTTVAHTVPFIATAALLVVLSPITVPAGVIALVFAWAIPELYAARGAKVIRPRANASAAAEHGDGASAAAEHGDEPERRALGLLADLVGHSARACLARTGLVLERGSFGVWVIGEAGALLVRPGGRRVNCYCVRSTDPELPSGDRIAHLLLALREDESGFATVANLAFSGARWRVTRRLAPREREALAAAAAGARG